MLKARIISMDFDIYRFDTCLSANCFQPSVPVGPQYLYNGDALKPKFWKLCTFYNAPCSLFMNTNIWDSWGKHDKNMLLEWVIRKGINHDDVVSFTSIICFFFVQHNPNIDDIKSITRASYFVHYQELSILNLFLLFSINNTKNSKKSP